MQKVIEFIVDKVTNYNLEIKKHTTVYYIEVVQGKLEFIDRKTFKLNESRYLTNLGISHQGQI